MKILPSLKPNKIGLFVFGMFFLILMTSCAVIQGNPPSPERSARVRAWLERPEAHPEWAVLAGENCSGAPFLIPTNGLIGFLWDDSFRVGHRHQGNYSGTPGNPTGVHLHFSIVMDDGEGQFLNELEIGNTLDPSPYLGLPLNAGMNSGDVPICPTEDVNQLINVSYPSLQNLQDD